MVAALIGVLYRELSVSGDAVSAGERMSAGWRGELTFSPSRRGEYGGGGDAVGSTIMITR